MLKILFIGHVLPYPPNSGQRLRNNTIVEALYREGHQTTLVFLSEEGETIPEELSKLCNKITLVPMHWKKGIREYSRRLQFIFSRRPYGVHRFKNQKLRETVRNYLKNEHFDVVLCDDIYNGINLPENLSIPVFLNKHDITYVKHQRFLKQERNPLKLLYGGIEYNKVRRWELTLCKKYDSVLACSKHDLNILKKVCPDANLYIVPNVIDVDKYTPTLECDENTVLFIGAMDWYPNCEAVEFFVYEMMPLLRQKIPHIKFVVAGRDPSDDFRKKFSEIPDVTFTGTIPDMREQIEKAAVCVVPLKIGSGTRLKILEAAAMCKPTVSTRIGAEGLDFINEKEIFLEDKPHDFAKRVEQLLLNARLRDSMGKAALKRVREQYSLQVLGASLRRALSSITGENDR